MIDSRHAEEKQIASKYSVREYSRGRDLSDGHGYAFALDDDEILYKKITGEDIAFQILDSTKNMFFAKDIHDVKSSIRKLKKSIKRNKDNQKKQARLSKMLRVLEQDLIQLVKKEAFAKRTLIRSSASGNDIVNVFAAWNSSLSKNEKILLCELLQINCLELMYVMPQVDNMYIRLRPRKIHAPHPTIYGGINPTVVAAGNIQLGINDSGQLVIAMINDDSNHFRPDPNQCAAIVKRFFEKHSVRLLLGEDAEFVNSHSGDYSEVGLKLCAENKLFFTMNRSTVFAYCPENMELSRSRSYEDLTSIPFVPLERALSCS